MLCISIAMPHSRAADWLRQAEDDTAWLADSIEDGHFAPACNIAQQGAENAVQNLAFFRGGSEIKDHSVTRIAQALAINAEIERAGKILEWLYGSLARGEANFASDIDLFIVADTELPFHERGAFFDDLRDFNANIELLVYTPTEWQRLTSAPTVGFWQSALREMVPLVGARKFHSSAGCDII